MWSHCPPQHWFRVASIVWSYICTKSRRVINVSWTSIVHFKQYQPHVHIFHIVVTGPEITCLWFLMIFPDFRIFLQISLCLNFVLKEEKMKRSSQQEKKEVVCIVSKPLVLCLWGCGESVNPPNMKHPGGSGGFDTFVKSHPCYKHRQSQSFSQNILIED